MAESTNLWSAHAFPEAERLLNKADFVSAFSEFAREAAAAAYDESGPARQALAWARMGSLVVMLPHMCLCGQEGGFAYYVRAIELNRDCIEAWLGILMEYGKGQGYHHDREQFDLARDYLHAHAEHLDSSLRQSIEEKIRRETS